MSRRFHKVVYGESLHQILQNEGVQDWNAQFAFVGAILDGKFPDSKADSGYEQLREDAHMKTPEFSRVFAAGLRAPTRWINLEKQEKTTARKLKRNKSKLGTLDPSHPEDQASESLSATHSAADATQQATPSAICQSAAPAQKPVPPIKIESDMRQTRPLSPLVAGPVPQACVPKTLSDPERTMIFDVFSSSGLTPPNGFEKKTLSELALILAQEKNQAALRAEQKEKEEAALREKQRAIRKAEQTERIARVHRWAERDEGTATVDNRHRAALYKAMFG